MAYWEFVTIGVGDFTVNAWDKSGDVQSKAYYCSNRLQKVVHSCDTREAKRAQNAFRFCKVSVCNSSLDSCRRSDCGDGAKRCEEKKKQRGEGGGVLVGNESEITLPPSSLPLPLPPYFFSLSKFLPLSTIWTPWTGGSLYVSGKLPSYPFPKPTFLPIVTRKCWCWLGGGVDGQFRSLTSCHPPLSGRLEKVDHYTFLGNCPPSPPLHQHFALSEKKVLM